MQIYLDANPVHCQLCFSKMATLMRANFLLSAGASPLVVEPPTKF